MAPRTVLLDMDGTLIDSNDAHAACWVEALAEFGYNVEFAQVRRLIGQGGDKLLPAVSGLSQESDLGQVVSKRRSTLMRERYMPHLKPFPRAADLLRRMHQDGMQLVLASSAQADELETLIRIVGAEGIIDATTSSSEAESSKPDPDIIAAALRKSRSSAAEALMVGDTPYDIEAAARAGVKTVALRCGGWQDAELHGAIALFDAPAHLLAEYERSPFAAAPELASAPARVP